ncbi:hypothetical protein GOP47_0009587 [Adiantum capillus-veneris]|uniref:PH domain-containing protein n=1 Tax=Adiantum capillus-veneris TaxID=13818 RepID=A0A9D4UWX4_ADICA|nr:hypothetical protein GOP47_0009587 [Adiantum capillus-veneris]
MGEKFEAEELVEEQPSSEALQDISEQLSFIPPSPGADSPLCVEGTLGDIMAAEFGNSSGQLSSTDAPCQDLASPVIAPVHEELTGAKSSQIVSLSLSTSAPPPPPPPATATSAVERESLGSSNLGGDEMYTALSFGDRETQSQQRILAFAAKRCANAVQKNPQDYDALYNWALVLQESADNINGDTMGSDKDQLLEEACSKYKAATDICPTLHEAFYNWAIAISDRAKARGRTKEAEELWKQACKRYERAVQLNRNSPQALNNWGLALQELSGIVSIKDKRSIVKTAIKKFRAAIALQFDFHRAIYNLGTVLYGLAEDTIRSGAQQGNNKELTATELYSQSAIYVATAHALKPEYPVYKSALRLVRSKLPLAYLKTGYLLVPPEGDNLAPHTDWKRSWFVLDHEAIYQVDKTTVGSSESSSIKVEVVSNSHESKTNSSCPFRIEVSDICGLSQSADLSLPSGAGFEIDTSTGQKYLIADSWEEVDCWVDAIRLAKGIPNKALQWIVPTHQV